MPKVKIHNRTKVAGTTLPNGAALEITIGDQKSDLAIGQTGTYDVSRNAVIRIEPKNRMMQKANWQSDGTTSDLYIIPANQDLGVQISYNDPDE
jgi:hypothetical protein